MLRSHRIVLQGGVATVRSMSSVRKEHHGCDATIRVAAIPAAPPSMGPLWIWKSTCVTR
jgi:hypothetical protein